MLVHQRVYNLGAEPWADDVFLQFHQEQYEIQLKMMRELVLASKVRYFH